ncbi:serine hydrolase domain-containing protein [Actinopolymorpha alba]|uniref:serine hydrolase domain-containing protein n=1 Tax=Actinopolymorpha alba TaxID=533267 RepID=UPI00039A2DC1|nr:serine hydrolase domain-containing protein [Actinopolymorpha alba]
MTVRKLSEIVRAHVASAVQSGYLGLVAGAVLDDRVSTAGGGSTGRTGPPPDARTIFRIASLSKVFSGTALAVAALRHEVALDDPVDRHLPGWFRVPAYEDGARVLVEHLATHTSGLPRGTTNPAAGESVEAMAAEVEQMSLLTRPGEVQEYSNLGPAILGTMLATRAGRSYDALIQERIAQPLGLTDVVLTLDRAQQARLAPGHDEEGAPTHTPTFPTGAPSGGFYGSVASLVGFLRAYLGDAPAELTAAAGLATRCHFNGPDGHRIGLLWHLDRVPGLGAEYAWHNGALPGYRAYLAVAREARAGVVVLTNQARSVDEIGRGLLTSILESVR